MIGKKNDVIYDEDGSLSTAFDGTSRPSATIVGNFPHIAINETNCQPATTVASWDNAIICNQNVQIRRIFFTNLMDKKNFLMQNIKVISISSHEQVVSPNVSSTLFTTFNNVLYGMEPMD